MTGTKNLLIHNVVKSDAKKVRSKSLTHSVFFYTKKNKVIFISPSGKVSIMQFAYFLLFDDERKKTKKPKSCF